MHMRHNVNRLHISSYRIIIPNYLLTAEASSVLIESKSVSNLLPYEGIYVHLGAVRDTFLQLHRMDGQFIICPVY